MRKIRLSDTDLELFDIEIGPNDYLFYQRHKDAFKTMWREQGKPFWTRFQITFRSFTVKHGIIKQMNIDSPKFQNILDQAFIFIHDHFVDGKESTAKTFIDDVARLAQNQDKFPALDSKSFSKDPFFTRDTRELFRQFFGPPDQKSSYLKVYILCPVFLRFGGSVCRCLIRWMDAPTMDDPNDDSYWVPPQPVPSDKSREDTIETTMCLNCVDDCGTKYFQEKIMGDQKGPISMTFWTLGDPRFNDPENPLFAAHLNPADDWRHLLSVDMFRDFYNYAKFKYGTADEKCNECQRLKKKRDKFIHVCKVNKKKKKQMSKDREELIVRSRIEQLNDADICDDDEAKIQTLILDKSRVCESLAEDVRQEKLEKLHAEQLKAEEDKKEELNTNKSASSELKKGRKKGLDENKNVNLNEIDEHNCKEENATKDCKAEQYINICDVIKSSKVEIISVEYNPKNSSGETSLMDTVSSNGSHRNDSSSGTRLINCSKFGDEINFSFEINRMDQQNSSNEIVSKLNSQLDGSNETNQTEGSNEIGQVVCCDENVATETENDGTCESRDNIDHEDIPHASENGSYIDEAAKHEFVKYSFLSDKDIAPTKNIVAGFKVIKIEDQENGFFEVNVSAACLKPNGIEDSYDRAMKDRLRSQELNNFILSANLIRENIHDLPQRLEWWEGRGFAVAVLNYEEEEKEHTKNWTHFTLKITGYEETAIKQTLIQLLVYVTKRKRRICYGWTMEVDDVVACILPEESQDVEDLSISISRGFRFEDRLTDYEKASMLKHHPSLNLDLVLIGVAKGGTAKTLEKKIGRDRLRKAFDTLVADRQIFAKDLPTVDVDKLRKKLNKSEITRVDILWEQMIRKPETFEFFVLYDKEKGLVETDWWKLGLSTMDIRVYNETRNPEQKLCPMCKTVGLDCDCDTSIVIDPESVKFIESTDLAKVNVIGGEGCPDLPKMNYTETNISMDSKSVKIKDRKTTKSVESSSKKEKRIELLDLPPKFLEAGINADKTTVPIPLRDEEPMMGKVPISAVDTLETLAPVPGVHSSLNFTFQNGKKEQKIMVTLGAYMPDDKSIEIEAEKNAILKLLDEEEEKLRKNSEALGHPEKMNKKQRKKKKSKVTSLVPNLMAFEGIASKSIRKKEMADLTHKFLQEICVDDHTVTNMTLTTHQHMGISYTSLVENKARKVEKGQAPCTCPHHDEIQKIKEEEERRFEYEETMKLEKKKCAENKEKLSDFCEEMMDLIDNKKTSRKYREVYIPKVIPAKEESEKPATNRRKLRKAKRKENGRVINRQDGPAEVESSVADRIPDDGVNDVDVAAGSNNVINGPSNRGTGGKDRGTGGKDGSSDEKEMINALRTCGSCAKVEPIRKAFKKCQKCKDEGVLEVRYYCSRDCQVNDWKNKHKLEHKDGLLG